MQNGIGTEAYSTRAVTVHISNAPSDNKAGYLNLQCPAFHLFARQQCCFC